MVLDSSEGSCTNHLVTLKQPGEKSLSANPWNSRPTPCGTHWFLSGKEPSLVSSKDWP